MTKIKLKANFDYVLILDPGNSKKMLMLLKKGYTFKLVLSFKSTMDESTEGPSH